VNTLEGGIRPPPLIPPSASLPILSGIPPKEESMSKKLRPLFARVVVRAETLQASIGTKYSALNKMGFEIPKTVEEKMIPDEGVVVSVGEACEVMKAGDRVLFGKWAAKPIAFEPGLYVMQEEDIIGVIEDDAKAVAA
jgi:co-chaperonin GroES (HSP10)